jgi:hypothetical protein
MRIGDSKREKGEYIEMQNGSKPQKSLHIKTLLKERKKKVKNCYYPWL